MHSSSIRKNQPFILKPTNLELSRKEQQYFNFTTVFQALTVWYVKVRQTPQLSSNYQLGLFSLPYIFWFSLTARSS